MSNKYLEKYNAKLVDRRYVFRIEMGNNEIEVQYYPEEKHLGIEDLWLVDIELEQMDRIISFLVKELSNDKNSNNDSIYNMYVC